MRTIALTTIALVVAGSSASAQFTTQVVAPKKQPQKQVAVDSLRKARADSVRQASLESMRAWVDSAAVALAAGGADSVRHPSTPVAQDTTTTGRSATVDSAAGEVATPRRRTGATTRFRDGERAPDTATPLPTLAVAGVTLVGGGVALLRRRRRA